MDKTRKAIQRAGDAELLDLYRNWETHEKAADQAIRQNAKGFGMDRSIREVAQAEVQSYRRKTFEVLEAEVKRRGLTVG